MLAVTRGNVIYYGCQPGSTMDDIPKSGDEIEAIIRARIASGEYPPGYRLPSYPEFMAEFRVSETTVWRVIRRLREDKTLIGIPGNGVFVPKRNSR